ELVASPIIITSARGIRARAIAEHVISVTLALARQLPEAMRYQMARHWAQNELEGPGSKIRSVAGLQMGIVGLGSIGLEIARLALPMGFRISAIRRRPGGPPINSFDSCRDIVHAYTPNALEHSSASDIIGRIDHVWPPERLPDLLAESDVVVLSL